MHAFDSGSKSFQSLHTDDKDEAKSDFLVVVCYAVLISNLGLHWVNDLPVSF